MNSMSHVRSAFEVLSLPDLSLPKYFDLFGEQSYDVAVSRLFGWLQLSFSGRFDTAFTLRYVYDPGREAQERLRVFVIVSAGDNVGVEAALLGRRLAADVLEMRAVDITVADPPPEDFAFLSTIERQASLVVSKGNVNFLPAVWNRGVDARSASEPYLDEAFSALDAPAFIEVQLHVRDGDPARQSLRSALERCDELQGTGRAGLGSTVEHYQALADAIEDDPVCRMFVCAGSRRRGVAESLLRRFGIDAIGGSRFRARSLDADEAGRAACQAGVMTGAFSFDRESGWFDSQLQERLGATASRLAPNQVEALRTLSELSVLVGPAVVKDVLCLPIPRRGYLRSFPLETERVRHLATSDETSKSGFVVLGRSSDRASDVAVPLGDLTRHVFVAGVTGSGKSVTMFNFLRQLGEQRVPFLVLEPAKTEYRRLLGVPAAAAALRVYTPGRDGISPIRINPFALEAHVSLAAHVAGLSASFSAALNLFEPIASMLEGTLWDLYESKGWLEDDLGSAGRPLPRVDDVPEALCAAILAAGYDPEIRDRFQGAVRSRFVRLSRGSVGRVFDCATSTPAVAELCASQAVVELAALSQQEANLVTMFLLTAIREHLGDQGEVPTDRPRLVVVLEEAHNLVPAVPDDVGGGEETSAKVEASRYVSNMLAEMRALGLSMVVVDQSPTAVSQQVLRNTNLKIAHRTVAKPDREMLVDVMLMNPTHGELLGRLLPGQAYVFADRFYRPHLVRAPYVSPAFAATRGATKQRHSAPGSTLTDEQLLAAVVGTDWFERDIKKRSRELRGRCEALKAGVARVIDEIEAADTAGGGVIGADMIGQWRWQLGEIARGARSASADWRAMGRSAQAAGKRWRLSDLPEVGELACSVQFGAEAALTILSGVQSERD